MHLVLREYVNTVGHILAGSVLAYLFIPSADLWILLLSLIGFGALREHIQELRNHDNGADFIKYLDTAGWGLGGLLYFLLRKYGNLDADKSYRNTPSPMAEKNSKKK